MEQKRYIFTIMTRDGVTVPNLKILAPDYEAAENKIKSMYRYCEILEFSVEQSNTKQIYTYEDVLELLNKQD